MIRFQDLRIRDENFQIVIRMAFYDILRRPQFIAYYEDFNVTVGGSFLGLFIFRIGYAIFFLMMMEGLDEYIVIDFDLQDGGSAHLGQGPFVALRPLLAPP